LPGLNGGGAATVVLPTAKLNWRQRHNNWLCHQRQSTLSNSRNFCHKPRHERTQTYFMCL